MKKSESERKRNLVKCYLDDREYIILKLLATRMNMSNSEVLRMSLSPYFNERVEKKVAKEIEKTEVVIEEKELIKNALYQLSKVGNNLNQLAKKANQGTVLHNEIISCLFDIRNSVSELKERIRHGNSKAYIREK